MSGPKVTVIGAGSYFFGKPIIHKMATSPIMDGGTLALVDTNKKVLDTMMALAKRVFAATKCKVKLVGSTDRKKVMQDSDFLVLSFSRDNTKYRKLDTEIAARHGIRMCSSDTVGPGGVFRCLRELPIAVDICKDAARICPQAWVINFVNPTAAMGMGLRRFASEVRSFALCDGNHEPYNTVRWCVMAGLLPKDATAIPPQMWPKLDLRIGGINHCTWVVKFTYAGKDMLPTLRRFYEKQAREEQKNPGEKAKPRFNINYLVQLFDLYGAIPTAVSHTKEYVPFFQGYGVKPNMPEPIRLFDADNRQEEMDAAWTITEQYANGKLPMKKFMEQVHNDHATDIIESMWGGLGKQFYINSPSNGAVTNLQPDAFLELRCDLDMRGPRPQHFGAMPRGILAIQQQMIDTHELTAEAAMTGDRTILRRAMLTDPLCNNIADADACIEDLLAAEKAVLPKYWYR
jgi:alpha-galactosidase